MKQLTHLIEVETERNSVHATLPAPRRGAGVYRVCTVRGSHPCPHETLDVPKGHRDERQRWRRGRIDLWGNRRYRRQRRQRTWVTGIGDNNSRHRTGAQEGGTMGKSKATMDDIKEVVKSIGSDDERNESEKSIPISLHQTKCC